MSGLIPTDHSVLALQEDLRYDSSMTNIDWTRLTEPVEKITRDEFERGYAERSRLTLEEFHRYLVAVPCECGEQDCQGWQAISMRAWKREQRGAA